MRYVYASRSFSLPSSSPDRMEEEQLDFLSSTMEDREEAECLHLRYASTQVLQYDLDTHRQAIILVPFFFLHRSSKQYQNFTIDSPRNAMSNIFMTLLMYQVILYVQQHGGGNIEVLEITCVFV